MQRETQTKNVEWSRFYHNRQWHDLEVLHAHFIDHRYGRHTHGYFVIALVESGAVSCWYRGAQHVASSSQIFVINPDEPHTGDPATPDGYVYRVLYPRVEHLSQVAADLGTSASIPFFRDSVLHDENLSVMLASFHRHLAGGAPTVTCDALLLRALARLVMHHTDACIAPRRIGLEKPAVRTACDYIQAHFGEDVSLLKLANLVSLSPCYFARAFERQVGLPPHVYLENVRVRKAREFLDQGHTVVSTALLTGYVDQSHLTHRFKRFLGITPGQYLRHNKIHHDH